MTNLLIQNARVLDPAKGRDETADLIIRGGVIQPPGSDTSGLPRRNAAGLIAAPGFWDVHVHFRDPGAPAAETRRTGAEAAAAGGFTHVVTMPNTAPAGDSPEWVREQTEDASLPVRILPAACVTRARQGREPADLEALAAAGAAAFTDDGAMVADDAVMRAAMLRARALGKPVMDHAVVPALAGNGVIRDCPLARRLGLPLFPPEAEAEAVRRDIRLCRETGCATHIQHISCAASVDAIRAARAEGLPVTGEASPHHLALAAGDIPADDGNYRMNPPLGTGADVDAIRAAVLDGTLTLFATDHAPHTAETKNHGFLKAAFGVIGLETALGVTWDTLVRREPALPLLDWVARWTTGPAALLGMPPPTLAPGARADLVLIDPSPWTVRPEAFRSRSRNTPFGGRVLHARPVLTVCEGRTTHAAEEAP
ncbi:MAG: dihydroorotase [Verrucomicrobiota bacterium]|jgi:dihydroorotase|nr:dihydroorotase [Verrucomicrobiota bacterium]